MARKETSESTRSTVTEPSPPASTAPGYVTTTIGVGNGDGTFNGTVEDTDVSLLHFGNIIKTGTGTQTFGGDCTIHGNLTVEDGTLTLADTGSITFYPTSNGVSNQVLGVDNGTGVGNGTVNANGAINIDLSNADPGWGNSWLLVDDTYLTVVPGATLTVTSPDGAFSEDTPGVWTLDTGGNLWTFTVATGTLSVSEGTAVAGYSDWADFYFDLLDTDPTLDYDGGGLETGIEYVVGGDPSIASDDNGLTPTGVVDASGNLIFTFRRSDLANEDPNTDIIVEYGSDLTGWTAAEDGVDGVTVTVNDDAFVSDYPGDPSTVDEVIVTLPASLANGDKIFARLRAEIDSL